MHDQEVVEMFQVHTGSLERIKQHLADAEQSYMLEQVRLYLVWACSSHSGLPRFLKSFRSQEEISAPVNLHLPEAFRWSRLTELGS